VEVKLPPTGLTVTVTFTDCPCFTDAELGLAATEKSIPIALKLAVCGLPEALSVILRDPDCVPPAVGRKVMEMMHVAVGASDDGQLLVWRNGPDTLMAESANAVLPVLVSVIVCAALLVPTSRARSLGLQAIRRETAVWR